ncbi:hypothetical protein [Falsiroseomonas oryzae]|uniref:hypothetical protein n=1 Tax=Falsiroseomonas oryzae TaxID=2766473 RepID=UPI0022EB5094|nr:hypothetical protein [Roseomonas sp. MO-31]
MRQSLRPRRAALALLALAAAGCTTQDPAATYIGGIGDSVRGAAIGAPALFRDTSRFAGQPAAAARAAVQLEFLEEAFRTEVPYSITASGTVLNALRVGQQEMRQAIGIAPDAPNGQVIVQLREAAAALDAGSPARAEAMLTGPAFPLGGAATLARLSALPRLPRVAEAGMAAFMEIQRMDSDRGRRMF